MSIKAKHFFEEAVALLEEIEALYDDADFDVEDDALDEDSDNFLEADALTRFIHHIRDAKAIAAENS